MILLVSSGNEDVCLGEFVTFTCSGYDVPFLKWNLTNHSGSYQSKTFLPKGGIGDTVSLNGFKANLTGANANGTRGNITLELSALVQLEMNETTIECYTVKKKGKISKHTELIIEGEVYDLRIAIIVLHYCL